MAVSDPLPSQIPCTGTSHKLLLLWLDPRCLGIPPVFCHVAGARPRQAGSSGGRSQVSRRSPACHAPHKPGEGVTSRGN